VMQRRINDRVCRDAQGTAPPARLHRSRRTFSKFWPTRYHQLIDEYLAGWRKPGRHLAN
jgi:hypothetical protein